MPKPRLSNITIEYPSSKPNPPQINKFYKSLSKSIKDKQLYKEFGGGAKRRVGFMDLTPLQTKTITRKAKAVLPKVKVKKTRVIGKR